MSNSIDNSLKFDEVTLENYIEIRRTLFKAFIESQFKYHPHVWMFHGRQTNHKINRLHESFLRICIMAMSQLFRAFYVKIINIQFIFQTFSLRQKKIDKTLNNLSGETFEELFTQGPDSYSVRLKQKLIIPKVSTILKGKYSLRYFTAIAKNLIPNDIKNIESCNNFRSKIKIS